MTAIITGFKAANQAFSVFKADFEVSAALLAALDWLIELK